MRKYRFLWRKRMIKDLFDLKYPIIQGAMAQVSYSSLVAAVSNQGALGTLSSYGLTGEQLKKEIQQVREKTTRPFSCNVMLQQVNSDELIEVILSENIPIVSLSAGFKPGLIQKLQENNRKVISVVGSKRQATKVIDSGTDCIVVEGNEAGGHIGNTKLETLLLDTLAMTKIPVVAAGGIMTNKDIQQKLQVGAAGVQLGTVFLLSQESSLLENSKKLLLSKKIKSEIFTKSSGKKFRAVRVKENYLPCGIGIDRINQILTVSEIIKKLK